jgi:hypothetical protein
MPHLDRLWRIRYPKAAELSCCASGLAKLVARKAEQGEAPCSYGIAVSFGRYPLIIAAFTMG